MSVETGGAGKQPPVSLERVCEERNGKSNEERLRRMVTDGH